MTITLSVALAQASPEALIEKRMHIATEDQGDTAESGTDSAWKNHDHYFLLPKSKERGEDKRLASLHYRILSRLARDHCIAMFMFSMI